MNSDKSLLITAFFLALIFLIPSKLFAQPRAYIPNINDTTVSVVDTGTNTLITNIEVGTRPSSAVVTPDGTKVYVTRNVDPAGRVVVIQTSTNTVLTTINVDRSPTDLAISPDGSTLWVANFNGVGSNRTISKIDTSTDMVINTINLPMIGQSCNPSGIVAHPTLDFVYVIANCHRLLTINTTTDTVLGTNRTVLNGENDIDITPDGSKIYVTDRFNSAVYIIDLPASGLPPTAVSDTISLSDGFCEASPLDVAVNPVVGSDNNFAWVMTAPSNQVPNGCDSSIVFGNLNYVRINRTTDATGFINGDPFETYSTIGFLRDGSSFYGLRITGSATEVQVSNTGAITVGTPISLGENGSRSTSPYFIGPDLYDLTINKTGNGDGTVTGSPAGIDCGAVCTAFFPENTAVDLTAVPDANSLFTGWSEDCSGSDPDTMINVMTTSLCEAEFTLIQFNVNININGSGSGTVTTTPGGIDCPGTCSAMFDTGDDITLNTNPASGSEFISWSGDPNCDDGVIDNLSGDISCTATFNDIDDCIPNPCLNGGICMDTGPNSFSCDCEGTGFEGPTCDIDIDECADPALNNCSTNATCTNIPGGFTCECNPGFTGNGISCIEIIGCGPPNPCQNGGICTDTGVNEINCECQDDFTGNRCQFAEDSSVIILPGTGGVFAEIIFGPDIDGGAEVLIDLPEDVFARSASLIPGIGGCNILDPLNSARINDPDIVCDVANVPGDLDVILDLCREGSPAGTVEATVGIVLDQATQEEFESLIDIVLSELEACSGGDDGSDDGGDDSSDSSDSPDSGCSLATGASNPDSAFGNLLIMFIPFIFGMIKAVNRRKKI